MKRYAVLWFFSILFSAFSAAGQLSHQLTKWVPERFENARCTHVTITNFMDDGVLGWYDYYGREIYLHVGSGTSDHVLAHEVGHAIWWRDLTFLRRAQWCVFIHSNHPELIAVYLYPNSCAHSFAEAFGEYVAEPQLMKAISPDVYGWFKHLTGTEFSTAPSWARR